MDPLPLRERVQSAEVVLPCAELGPTLGFFTDELGFRVDAIHPAEDPSVAVLSGHGVCLRLERGDGAPGRLRLTCRDTGGRGQLVAPNGTRIELVEAEAPLELPALVSSLTLSRALDAKWTVGRAGMRYRDLIPGRQGGRFAASLIQIPGGGPVPDYVHYHRVRFQMIFCAAGWVRVVYEDQGPPFVLNAGDCALQPPGIRHRVLEASPGLEVIELSSPAVHETLADHELELPTPRLDPDREFSGQRFARRPEEISAATGGLASVEVVRPSTGPLGTHDGELLFHYVLAGAITLRLEGRAPERLGARDAVVLPAGAKYGFEDLEPAAELLRVALPAC